MIYDSLTQLIGKTPILRVPDTEILLKLECFNPGGSSKDRAALSMIEDAESKGLLTPGATIIEPTSGNTGIGLAWIGSLKGYRVILTMPSTMSEERRSLLRAFGAELELTPGPDGMAGAIRRAGELLETIPGAVILEQFGNPANPLAHELTTGEEIWEQTQGKVGIFIAGVGTGGTLCGAGRALKRHNPAIEVVAVEPASSPVLSKGWSGPHGIPGIGAGFVPKNYDPAIVDKVVTVSDQSALEGVRALAADLGLLAGISSGAAYSAALELSKEGRNAGKTIVALLPDSGERYLSTGAFDPD